MARAVFDDVFKKGEEIFQNVSGKLLERPEVAKALEAAMAGKSKMDEGLAIALKRMNVQTRGEFRALRNRVESLEAQLAELKEALSAQKKKAEPRSRPKAAKRG